MKASEIREKDSATILADLEASHKEMFNLKIGFQTGSVDNPHGIRALQKDIARMLTILRERQLAAEFVEKEAGNG
jgi:large subunit ribosomal protein L29